ncbi:MAG: TIM barrel protein [Phycisphaerae bacterium]|nr:TIM barrel protein [Phycisphaerae bacterium]
MHVLGYSAPISPTIAPLTGACGGDIRRALGQVAAMGFTHVQLSAAQRGTRPRDLGRRARRDLAAALARQGLAASGLDLFIPRGDWLDSALVDRAVSAAVAALEMAADLGHVPLSLSLPVEELGSDVVQTILAGADGRGVALAVHAEHDLPALRDWLQQNSLPLVGVGIDPAALLSIGEQPEAVAGQLAQDLKVARFDDHRSTDVASAGGRCPVGEGELDAEAYRVALALCPHLRAVVVELRHLADPAAALAAATSAWDRAAPRGM